LPLILLVSGEKGTVYKYVRPNGRCPASAFLAGCIEDVVKKFEGSFDVATKIGSTYYNHQRFKPLHNEGKPLWEFKEHSHRIYCMRTELPAQVMHIVLLNGWTKDKDGKAKQEAREIKSAKALLTEMQQQLRKGEKK